MAKGNGFFGEFKKFIMRGNVIDLAVGVIVGGAFQAIVKSLVDDVVMPVISLATKGINFADLFIALDGGEYATLAAAQEAGAATLNYGNFISAILNFLIMAFVVFLLVKGINTIADKSKNKEEAAPAAPTTKECPYCKSEIAIGATKCPNCTSDL
ncbi:MAG: large conductance mechanosensitive channel protein MscL [Clostridia bacterium]|nr:large conductance mechanosensitive channel protein MscL [Clostridia bacterium]